MTKKIFLFLFLLFSFQGNTQSIPQISDIPDYFSLQQKDLFTNKKNLLLELKGSIKNKIEQFNTKCGNVPESRTTLIKECEAEQVQIRKEKKELIDAINKFNTDILFESDSLSALIEEKSLTSNFEGWISDQQVKVKEAVLSDSAWTDACINIFKGFSPADSSIRPRGLKDLKNGDVLLLFPKSTKDKLIDIADKLYNGYSQKEEQKACHALIFIGRDASGRCLFLNNTAKSYLHPEDSPGGPHITGQTEFEQMYGQSDYYVARPRTPVDGRVLLKTAQEMQIEARKKITLLGSQYGVLGHDIVCSEASDIAVARATGRDEINKGKFIDVTPNNFFDKEDAGRYYIISPLVKHK